MSKKKPVKPPKQTLTPEQIRAQANDKALAGLYGAEGANAGNALINKFVQPGSLGRVSTDLAGGEQTMKRSGELLGQAGASAEEQDTIARMKAGLGGYSSPEYQASREQMMRGQQSNFATAQGQLAKAQARGKVYGAAGAAQQANLASSAQVSKDNLEQDLMVKNIDEQRSRLAEYGQYGAQTKASAFDRTRGATNDMNTTQAGLRNETLDREKINIGQANAETAAQIGLYTGAGSSALAKEGTKEANQISREGLRAQGWKTAKEKAALNYRRI